MSLSSPSASGSVPSSTISTSSPGFSSSPLSSPSSGGNGNGGSGSPSISRSSSLLFGFLITFLALFVGFMACGYSSRRAAHIRRGEAARMGEYGHHRRIRMKKPHLWDVWIAEGPEAGSGNLKRRAEGWKSIMPLSASMLQPGADSKTTSPGRETFTLTPEHPRDTFPSQEYSPSYILGARGLGRFYSAAPLPPLPVHRRPPHELTMSRLVLPPSDLTLPQPGFLSLFRRPLLGFTPLSHRSRGIDRDDRLECSPRGTNAEEQTQNTSNSAQAQISVLIAMPSPTANSFPQPKKSSSIFEAAIVEEAQDDRPRGNFEIGIARVRVSSPNEMR